MKSTVCYLSAKGIGLRHVLDETEKTAAYARLGKRQTLQLRLLAEELTGILKGVTGSFMSNFWIEEENRNFELNLVSDVHLNQEKREKLISISTTGTNEASRGIMGKIGQLFAACIDNFDEVGTYCAQNGMVLPSMQMKGHESMENGACRIWSLQEYKEYVQTEHKEEEWDELECSIVANLADDVHVHIKNRKVHITIFKSFMNCN